MPSSTPFAQGWCSLSVLHERIHSRMERALQDACRISVREYSVLQVLDTQQTNDKHLHLKHVAEAIVLSQSATTRLVMRLEERGLLSRAVCDVDRRGIYTNVTKAGRALLATARPASDRALHKAFDEARRDPQLLPLVEALEKAGFPG